MNTEEILNLIEDGQTDDGYWYIVNKLTMRIASRRFLSEEEATAYFRKCVSAFDDRHYYCIRFLK